MPSHLRQRLGSVAVRLRVIGLQRRRRGEGGNRFLVAAQRRQHVTPPLPCLGKIRTELERRVEGRKRVGVAPRLNQRLALVAESLRVAGLQGDRPVEIADRFVVAGKRVENGAAVVPGLGHLRGKGERAGEGIERLKRPVEAFEDDPVVVERCV